jgi:hypothetical protein
MLIWNGGRFGASDRNRHNTLLPTGRARPRPSAARAWNKAWQRGKAPARSHCSTSRPARHSRPGRPTGPAGRVPRRRRCSSIAVAAASRPAPSTSSWTNSPKTRGRHRGPGRTGPRLQGRQRPRMLNGQGGTVFEFRRVPWTRWSAYAGRAVAASYGDGASSALIARPTRTRRLPPLPRHRQGLLQWLRRAALEVSPQ